MNTSAKFLLSAVAACAALSAHAGGMNTADSTRITNGGTGFIGVTESYGQPKAQWSTADARGITSRAGEATTFVNGRPNQNPEAPGMAMGAQDTRAMGASAAMAGDATVAPAWRHRSWGTPD